MIKMMRNWRYWVLAALGAVVVICILGEPIGGNIILQFAGSKAVALIAAYMFVHLLRYWASRNEIDDIIKNVKEED